MALLILGNTPDERVNDALTAWDKGERTIVVIMPAVVLKYRGLNITLQHRRRKTASSALWSTPLVSLLQYRLKAVAHTTEYATLPR